MRYRRATGCGNACGSATVTRSLQVAGKASLLLVVLPGLGDAVGVAREADLEQVDLLGRDWEQLAERGGVDGAARVLLHLQAVEEHLRYAVGVDHAAVPAQQTAA